jgi:tetratricopeptide (TPR) repeat protein
LGDRAGQARALDGLGLINRHLGNLLLARDIHEKALALALSLDDLSQIAASQTNLGHILVEEEKREQAIELYQRALEIMVELNTVRIE